MFRRPSALPPLSGPVPVVRETYPVVKREKGTPREGENSGIKATLFDAIKNFLNPNTTPTYDESKNLADQGGEYTLNEFDFNLLYPGVDFDSVTIEERTIGTNSDDYKKLIEKQNKLQQQIDEDLKSSTLREGEFEANLSDNFGLPDEQGCKSINLPQLREVERQIIS